MKMDDDNSNKKQRRAGKPAEVVYWGMNSQYTEEQQLCCCDCGRMDSGMAVGTTTNTVLAPEEEEEKGDTCEGEGEHDLLASGRERLKRHRTEVAGRVWIPETWGQEEFLMDWVDCTVFDSSMVPSQIISARAALVDEGRRRASSPVLQV
ncbi:hypothetical protein MLD38_032497 [Melastoma candidum]|uniref:Uncharacterized protein n=1 Tax=Melastoma candidum TaxID=119954 RepID=A0ACB9M472_9MYRT|nr:hypothetical protein MLD38_032497 [Melastoma candidum]